MSMPRHMPGVLCFRFSLLAFLLLTGLTLSTPGHAASITPQTQPSSPSSSLATLLTHDGTLNLPPGFSGSIDTKGWELVSGENEPPRFAPLSRGGNRGAGDAGSEKPRIAGDEKWVAGFGPNGVNGTVLALATDNNGNLYVGGEFGAVGTLAANNVAKWDGST